MQRFHDHFNAKKTPQGAPIPGAGQVPNRAGGFVWELDRWDRLDRFLVLGTEGGTYYASERTLTIEDAKNVLELLKEDGPRVVVRIADISTGGKAYKNAPALFALALAFAHGDPETRKAAEEALPRVARTGTHLFAFLEYIDSMRGWGRGLRRAVANWYEGMPPEKLAYQVTKYQQRGGWSHRDALRLAHPMPKDAEHDALYGYIVGGAESEKGRAAVASIPYLEGVEEVKDAGMPSEAAELVRRHELPREVLPTELLGEAAVWGALLEKMPMTAMIRNLATMTRVGLLKPMSEASALVAERLRDRDRLKKARIHPVGVLAALTTYGSGHGARGQYSWEPVREITDALDDAFYLSFENVEPTRKRIVLALDVSGSMSRGMVAGVPGFTPRVATAALALVTAATEERYALVAFSHEMVPLGVSPRERLDDALRKIDRLPFGRTNCALPMLWALESGVEADAFVVLTDSETWYGKIHPAQALQEYRRKTGIPAKLAVVGMVSNGFSIADPNDASSLDVVGFDTATPQLISNFIAGRL